MAAGAPVWNTTVVGTGGPDDGTAGFFVYVVQSNSASPDKFRLKLTRDGVSVYVSGEFDETRLEMLIRNEYGTHRPRVSPAWDTFDMPDNSNGGPLTLDTSSQADEQSLLISLAQTHARTMQRSARWKTETNARIAEINKLVSEIIDIVQ